MTKSKFGDTFLERSNEVTLDKGIVLVFFNIFDKNDIFTFD